MSVEAPEAVQLLQRSFADALSSEPRAPRRAGLRGE
jgi:hypothetical protein